MQQIVFPQDESRHIVKVLRKKEGDTLYITNGKGYLFKAEIISAHQKKCLAQVISQERKEPTTYHLHMAVAPTKTNDRFEWFLEKATEIGVNEITPIICQQSERKVIKQERLEKVLQSAMKQSLQTFLPKLNPAVSFGDFISKDRNGLLCIAHCQEGEKTELKQHVGPRESVTILIGPEGDFSSTEVEKSLNRGFVPVGLGKNRLRTETAAIMACATVALLNND